MVKKIFILSFFFCLTVVSGQQKLRRADKLFEEFAYTEAAQLYKEYLAEAKDPKPETLLKAAEANYYIGNNAATIRYFEQYIKIAGEKVNTKANFYYANALFSEEMYEKGDFVLFSLYKSDKEKTRKLGRQKRYLDSLSKTPAKYALSNLGINTKMADFGTAFYGSKVVYASGKDTLKAGGKTYSWNKQPYLTLYVSDSDTTNGAFVNEQKFLPKAQTDYHNAAPAFSPDLKTVYYSANTVNIKDRLQNSTNGTNNIRLIKGRLQNGELIEPQDMLFNSKNYSVGQAAVSTDGKWLYFVSDMPGGYGETDIYMASIYSDGTIGDPKNLGPTVNTTGREMFPSVDENTLYFSSDGHYGLGGLDIFKSEITNNAGFTEPQNIGKPINSNRDDFAFIISKSGAFGYLSSNRTGGKGDDDIYYFTVKSEPCGQLITGTVINKKTGQPIEGVSVKAQVNGAGYTDASKSDGTYSISIPCGDDVIVEASKPDHTIGRPNEKGKIELSEYKDLVTKENNVEKITINPIYFDFDEYYITPQAAIELDKVVYVMQNFPNVIIKIESHTDSRGNDDYNMQLSDDRAKSTYSYIVSKGIFPSRIESVKGYGESQLRNRCANGIDCTPEEHQLNRRSDFIIVIR